MEVYIEKNVSLTPTQKRKVKEAIEDIKKVYGEHYKYAVISWGFKPKTDTYRTLHFSNGLDKYISFYIRKPSRKTLENTVKFNLETLEKEVR